MTKCLLTVDYQGAIETPMIEWSPDEIKAHMDLQTTRAARLNAKRDGASAATDEGMTTTTRGR